MIGINLAIFKHMYCASLSVQGYLLLTQYRRPSSTVRPHQHYRTHRVYSYRRLQWRPMYTSISRILGTLAGLWSGHLWIHNRESRDTWYGSFRGITLFEETEWCHSSLSHDSPTVRSNHRTKLVTVILRDGMWCCRAIGCIKLNTPVRDTLLHPCAPYPKFAQTLVKLISFACDSHPR